MLWNVITIGAILSAGDAGSWSFGQFMALTVWLPVITKFIYSFLGRTDYPFHLTFEFFYAL